MKTLSSLTEKVSMLLPGENMARYGGAGGLWGKSRRNYKGKEGGEGEELGEVIIGSQTAKWLVWQL